MNNRYHTELYNLKITKSFDWDIQMMIFDAAKRIEVAFLEQWVEIIGRRPENYYENLSSEFKSSIKGRYKASKNDKVIEYREKNSECHEFVPLHFIRLILTFGDIPKLINCMNVDEKKEILDAFHIDDIDMFSSIISHLIIVRNRCAHAHDGVEDSGYLCTEKFKNSNKVTIHELGTGIDIDLCSLFGTLTVLNYMLFHTPQKFSMSTPEKWKHRLVEHLDECPSPFNLSDMGFPDDWKLHPFWKEPSEKSEPEIVSAHHNSRHARVSLYSPSTSEDDGEFRLDQKQSMELMIRAQCLSAAFRKEGWAARMDNCDFAAINSVFKSIIGFEDEGLGFPLEWVNLATALAGKENGDLVTALNDYNVRRIFNDATMMDVPKGASDEKIFDMTKRWMILDQERRDSGFHDSVVMRSYLTRRGGPIATVKTITFLPGDPVATEAFWMCWPHIVKRICLNALCQKCGKDGLTIEESNNEVSKIEFLLDRSKVEFKNMIEEEFGLRDPNVVGSGPYTTPFILPLLTNSEMEKLVLSEVDNNGTYHV